MLLDRLFPDGRAQSDIDEQSQNPVAQIDRSLVVSCAEV